jgi:menaquinone-9 beta-reductase
MSSETAYDVAVIGGGLAGLSLAIQCADAGFSVVLFEREQYPFHKVCGEYISMESYPFLQRLGLDLNSLHLPLINKLCITSVAGKQFRFPLPLGGFGISRYMLDNALYELAVSKGVAIQQQTKVQNVAYNDDRFTIDANGKQTLAKVAVGSFGKRSNIDIKWNRSFTLKKSSGINYVAVKYHIRYPHDDSEIVLHNFADGYCGMSRIEEGNSCLCYLTTAAQLKNAGNSIKLLEQQLLYKNPHLKHIFSTATFLYDEPLAISQVSFARKAAVENHVLMTGDAAGLITPLCGNGMSMAMHASKLCFNQIEQFLLGKSGRETMEKVYAQEWRKQFSTRLAAGRVLQKFFGEPKSTELFLRLMKRLPGLSSSIIKVTHGKVF